MITIESDTQDKAELEEAIKSAGMTIVEDPAEVTEDDKTAESGEPGDKIPAEPVTEPAAEVAEPVEDKPQEVSQGTEVEPPKKSKGGFQYKLEKKTAEVERLREDLEAERGDKSALRDKLAEAEARLAELQPTKPAAEPELVEPTEPELPALDELVEDRAAAMAKYNAARAKYRTDYREYQEKLIDRNVQRSLKGAEQKREQERIEREAEAGAKAFNDRLRAQSATYEDWDEVMSGEDLDITPAVRSAIIESDIPGDLLYFLVTNPTEHARIMAFKTPVSQVRELGRLEDRLIAAKSKPSNLDKKPEPAKAEVPDPEKPPVKETPKRVAATEPPIEPLGGKTVAASNGDLRKRFEEASERGDSREAQKLLALLTQQEREKKYPSRPKA